MRHKLRFYLCELEIDSSSISSKLPNDEMIYSTLKSSLVDVAGESCLGRSQKYLAVRLLGDGERSNSNSLVLIRGPASEEKHIRAAIILIKSINNNNQQSFCALRIVRVASSIRTLEIALKKRGMTTSAAALFGVGGLSGKRFEK
jgi:hypothetical protein